MLKLNMKIPFSTKPFCLRAHRASSRAMSALERLAKMAGDVVEVATGKSPKPEANEAKGDSHVARSSPKDARKAMESSASKKPQQKVMEKDMHFPELAPSTPLHRIRKRRKSMSPPLRPLKRPSSAHMG